MTTYRIFVDAAEAERFARALGLSTRWMTGGKPALPRCDHPRWAHADHVTQSGGRHTPDPCTDPTDPHPSCPYATRAHSRVLAIGVAGYAVEVDDTIAAIEGESVTVDARAVTISTVDARELTAVERSAITIQWDGRQ